MKKTDILLAMNTEQNPLHWTKHEQDNAITSAVNAINRIEEKREKIYKEMKINGYVSASYICPECNWNIDSQDRHCKRCGQALEV